MAEDQSGRTQTGHNEPAKHAAVVPAVSAVANPPLAAPCSQTEPCYTKDAAAEQLSPHWRRPEWVIVYVTVIYVWIAGLTLWAIKKQADTMGKQLAFQQETLRPRLSIAKFTRDTFNEARLGQWVFIDMEISNSGGMPAYGVIADTWIEFVPGSPPYNLSSSARYRRSAPFNVHTGVLSGFGIPLHRKLTDVERHQLAKAEGTIVFRIKLLYQAFGDEVHTDEAYIVRPNGMDAIPEYASAT